MDTEKGTAKKNLCVEHVDVKAVPEFGHTLLYHTKSKPSLSTIYVDTLTNFVSKTKQPSIRILKCYKLKKVHKKLAYLTQRTQFTDDFSKNLNNAVCRRQSC